jgi:hypothetical protein
MVRQNSDRKDTNHRESYPTAENVTVTPKKKPNGSFQLCLKNLKF